MPIKVYSQPACAPCANLKYWLKSKKLDYQEEPLIDHIDRMRRLGFMSAPVVEIGDRFFSGSNLSAIAEYLGV